MLRRAVEVVYKPRDVWSSFSWHETLSANVVHDMWNEVRNLRGLDRCVGQRKEMQVDNFESLNVEKCHYQ